MYRPGSMSGPGSGGWSHGGPDRVTNVSYHRKPGFFEQIGNSVCGAFFGIALIVAACPLLFWNEGRAVQTAMSLDEGLRLCVNLNYGSPTFSSNNGRLIHFGGLLTATRPLVDHDFGVSIYASHLTRTVEMYQWVESQETREHEEHGEVRRETTYSYSREWRSDLVRSDNFQNSMSHRNPSSMPLSSLAQQSSDVKVSEFLLSPALVDRVHTEHVIQPHTVRGLRLKPNQRSHNGYVVQSAKPNSNYDEVGDIRFRWSYRGCSHHDASDESVQCSPQEASIIAQQRGSAVGPYQTGAGDVLELLYEGVHSSQSMFEQEHSSNNAMTWVMRLVGFVLMFIGFNMVTSIVTTITSRIPFFGAIINFGITLLNFSLALTLAMLVIAIGWLRYRPLLSLTLLAIGMSPYLIANLTSRPKNR